LRETLGIPAIRVPSSIQKWQFSGISDGNPRKTHVKHVSFQLQAISALQA
jgi:hypothetical protein